MKILFLAPTPFFSLRGTPINVLHVLKRLSDRGHKVDLLTFPIGENINLPGLRIIRCGQHLFIKDIGLGPSLKKLILDLALFFKFFKIIILDKLKQNKNYDCIHSLDELTLGCWLLKCIIKCPIIYDMDSSIVEQFEANNIYRYLSFIANWVEKKMISVASVIVPVCDSLASRIEDSNPLKPVIVLYDIPNINSTNNSNITINTIFNNIKKSDNIILYTGSLGNHQGIELLIKAFKIIKNGILNAKLVIAGGNNGEITSLSKLDNEVVFLGAVEPKDLTTLYDLASVVVSPRISGTNTPMKIFDYMASGKVIVATRLQTHTQVLDDNCAILCDPSPEGIAEALILALTNKQEALELAIKAKKKLEEKFNPELFNLRLQNIYESAIRTGVW